MTTKIRDLETKPKKPTPVSRWDFDLGPKQLAEMEQTAREWLSDPAKLRDWLMLRQFIIVQIAFKMIESPVHSRSGPDKLIRSIDQFIEMAAGIVGVIDGKKQSEGALPEDVGRESGSGADDIESAPPAGLGHGHKPGRSGKHVGAGADSVVTTMERGTLAFLDRTGHRREAGEVDEG
jgi:hypothetical protein